MTKQLAHTMYGQPVTGMRPAGAAEGSKLAPGSGPYIGRNRCIAKEDTCEGPRANGTEYCVGHLRAVKRKEA